MDVRRVELRRGGGLDAGRGGARTGFRCPPGWLLVEFPTALLLAVFVGTGWLGYAQHGRPTTDAPVPAVVVPAPGEAPFGPGGGTAPNDPGMR